MTAIIEILFWRDSSRNHSHVTLARFLRLQSYFVFIRKDCNHIWSVWDMWLQTYLAPFVAKIAIIFGPFCDQDCNHIWSPSEKLLQS